MTAKAIAHPIGSSMLKSILLALPVAILAIGAADNITLPQQLQNWVSHLDITKHLPPGTFFVGPAHLFAYWVLPLNVAFYGGILFLIFFWKSTQSPAAQGDTIENVEPVLSPTLTPAPSEGHSLAKVPDPTSLIQQMALLPIVQESGTPKEVQVLALKKRGKDRRTFEISFTAGLVGKVYAANREDVYEFMVALKNAGFNREAEFSIPQPIAYLPQMRLLLQEKVEGVRAARFFNNGDRQQQAKVAERCGQWLARFHALAPSVGELSDAGKLLRKCERKRHLIEADSGRLGEKARKLSDSLKDAQSLVSNAPACAGHGDYGTYQILVDGPRTVVFDWDTHDVADPARDVARYLISLERQALRHFGSLRALDFAAEIFVDSYLAQRRESSSIIARMPFYKAAFYLRGAVYDLRDRPKPHPEWAEVLLDEGLKCLDEVNSPHRVTRNS